MKTFYNEQSNNSGIYKITNTTNGRIYIGSAKEFKSRYKSHIKSLKKGSHHNKFLQNDFNKCGEEAFEFHVIEVISGEQSERLLAEQRYIDKYFDKQEECYNFKPQTIADSRSCFSKNPEETRRKLREKSKALWQNPEYVEKRMSSLKKLVQDSEYKKKLSEAQLKSWSDNEERKEKTSTSIKKFYKENPEMRKKLSEIQKHNSNTEERKEASKQKAIKLNERYKNDELYRNKMNELSIKNIKEFNEKKNLTLKPKGSLISPDGVIYYNITNVNKFAKEHNLDSSTLYKLFKQQAHTIKGWKVYN